MGEEVSHNGDPIAEKVIEIVAKERGMQPSQLSLHTDLYKDTGLYGDDVDELLEALHREFSIDFSSFQFRRHFEDEASPFGCLWMIAGVFVMSPIFVAVIVNVGPVSESVKFLVCMILVLIWTWLGQYLPSSRRWGRERIPVRVKDLVEAAKAKRWMMAYTSPSKS